MGNDAIFKIDGVMIFTVDEYYWYAARSKQDAIDKFFEDTGEHPEYHDDVSALSQDAAKETIFFDDLENMNTCSKRSYAEQLDNMVSTPVDFPCLFAISSDVL